MRNIKLGSLLVIMLICLLFILTGLSTIHCLTCIEVREFPPQRNLTSEEIQAISAEDIVDCLQHIAQKHLRVADARYLWEALVGFYNGISNIPEDVLAQLHWVTPAIETEEYENLTIGSINVVKNFGFSYNLDPKPLEAIANRVREDFAGKTPDDYSFYDLLALNQILCAFNRSEIDMIHPSAYKEAASVIGKLENCSTDVMLGFANLAVHEKAFGPSQNWTGLVLKTVGSVAKYLPGGITKEFEKRIRNDEDEPEEIKEPLE